MHKAHHLLAIALLGLAAAAAAQDADVAAEAAATEAPEIRRYAVEIILFRYGDGVPAGNEIFRPDPPPEPEPLPYDGYGPADDVTVPSFGDLPVAAADDAPPAAPDAEPEIDLESIELEEIVLPTSRVELKVLPRDALTLAEVHEKLELLDAYEPVLWAGWTQLVIERDLSPAIPLRRLGSAPAEFDGELTLYLSRFLHLVVDLTLTPRQERSFDAYVPSYGDRATRVDTGYFFEPDSGTVRLRIDEDRIVKNGDLRYFDHPRFGLLAKVTRVEEAAPVSGDDTEFLAPAPVER